MGERLTVSRIEDFHDDYPGLTWYDRDEYYDRLFVPKLAGVKDTEVVTQKIKFAPHVFFALLFNRAGQLILQVRSAEKRHNPGLRLSVGISSGGIERIRCGPG